MKQLLEGVLLLLQESNQMEHYLGLVHQKLLHLVELVSRFSHSKRRRVQGGTFEHLRIPLPASIHPTVCEPPLTALGKSDYHLPEHRVFRQLLGHSQLPQELFPNPHGVLTFKRKTQSKSIECWLPNQSVGWLIRCWQCFKFTDTIAKNLHEMFLSVCSMSRSSAQHPHLRQTTNMNLNHVSKFSPQFSITVYYFYSKISRVKPILSLRIVLDSIYLLIFYSEKFSCNLNLMFVVCRKRDS